MSSTEQQEENQLTMLITFQSNTDTMHTIHNIYQL